MKDLLVPDKALQIIIAPTEADFNRVAAEHISNAVASLNGTGLDGRVNTSLARGNTQTGIYEEICKNPEMLRILSQARFFQLDEVYPAPKSFKEFTEEEILSAVFKGNIPSDQWITFDTSLEAEQAIQKMRGEFEWYGDLDLAVLGLGAEGDDHYAQVGPGVRTSQDIINPRLSDGMIHSYASYVGLAVEGSGLPTHGLSLAHGAMPDHLIITAKGTNKARPVLRMLAEQRLPNDAPEVSTTFLRDQKNVTVILDADAAKEVVEKHAFLPMRAEMIEYNP